MTSVVVAQNVRARHQDKDWRSKPDVSGRFRTSPQREAPRHRSWRFERMRSTSSWPHVQALRLRADRFLSLSKKETMETPTTQKNVYLTQAEVADMLHHGTTATLRWWRHQNCGPKSISHRKARAVQVVRLEAWLAAQEAETARGGVPEPHPQRRVSRRSGVSDPSWLASRHHPGGCCILSGHPKIGKSFLVPTSPRRRQWGRVLGVKGCRPSSTLALGDDGGVCVNAVALLLEDGARCQARFT